MPPSFRLCCAASHAVVLKLLHPGCLAAPRLLSFHFHCTVVDNVFGPETAAALREELAAVRGTEAMHKASLALLQQAK